ncbi:MAG: hypothetical protein KFW07_00650, partial [Mycoplasmataceae bacterium]|nr:hypothetical protein [Mycoplasmataceae bacterium]
LVKVEYGIYVRDGIDFRYEWSETRPLSVVTIDIPAGQTNYPIAIRFTKKVPTDNVEIGSIESALFKPSDTVSGYEVDLSNITTIINIDSTDLVNRILFSGYINDLNAGVSNTAFEDSALQLVEHIFRDKVVLKYQVSTIPDQWFTLTGLKIELAKYLSDFKNSTSGIIIFDNGTTAGATITAKFESKDPAYQVNVTPDETTVLKTDKIKTKINLREYVSVLRAGEVIPSGNSSANIGTLTFPSMPDGNVLFGGRTFEQIQSIIGPSIEIQFKTPGFHGDAWVSLDKIVSLNSTNELFIRFFVKVDSEINIELSIINENDYKDHYANGFQLKVALPIVIPTDPNDLIASIVLTGNTKELGIEDQKVYDDLYAINAIYTGKVQILYSIGKDPIALDPTQPSKLEFNKVDFIRLLLANNVDILLSNKEITARYALADGVDPADFEISNEGKGILNIDNVKIFINKANYYEMARLLKVFGPSTGFQWGPEHTTLLNALSPGLTIQYSNDNTALETDPNDSPKWSLIPLTTLDPNTKFLVVRLVTNDGYVFEELPEMFNVNTDSVILVIDVQSIWLQQIKLLGNTRNIDFNLTDFDKFLVDNSVAGQEHIVVKYHFLTDPGSNNIDPTIEWYTAAEVKAKFLTLQGAKNKDELILFRNSLRARYSLSDEGFKKYRFKIDGKEYYGDEYQSPNIFLNLVDRSLALNDGFEGYINLDLIKVFKPDSFQIRGTNETPTLTVLPELIKIFDYYKDQSTTPFDIFYTNVKDDFSNTNWKLFNNTGFVTGFASDFKILVSGTTPQPIFFKIVARPGYNVYEGNNKLPQGKVIEITDIKVILEIKNPLAEAPRLEFKQINGDRYYQGFGSVVAYDKASGKVVDNTFLNSAFPVAAPLSLEYNVSEYLYSKEEEELVAADPTKWGVLPTNLKVNQFVMTRVALKSDGFVLVGGDTMTPQARVKGLLIKAADLVINKELVLVNADEYGYSPIDGKTVIDEVKFTPDINENYLGAEILMSIESEFYRSIAGDILVDGDNIPIIKRDKTGAETFENYKDSSGRDILDENGNAIPVWVVQKNGIYVPAKPIRSNVWTTPEKMRDNSLGSFSQENESSQWRLFQGQFVRFSIKA